MPETVRATGGRLRGRLREGFTAGSAAALGVSVTMGAARADGPTLGANLETVDLYLAAFAALDRHEIITMVMMLGILFFAVTSAIMLVRSRARNAAAQAAARDEIIRLKAAGDRLSALLFSERQVLVSWGAADDTPVIMGDLTLVTDAATPQRVLAFGSWLEPDKAQAMDRAVDALRAEGTSFSLQVMTLADQAIEAEGRAIGGRAVLRLRAITGAKRELAELAARHEKLLSETASLRALIDALPSPIWMRDAAGALVFVNAAYARGVEARDAADALTRGIELLDRNAREDAARSRAMGKPYAARVPAIVAGSRRTFDMLDLPTREGSVGAGIDVTEAEAAHAELKRLGEAHRRTLDQLATGVVSFGADGKLEFYNTAYRSLWDLDPAFLDQTPTDSAVLDQLRAARKLPEEKDFREWKTALHDAYRATEAKEHWWHLPDGRTLRVVTTPNPQGGVTYLFEDTTERLDLARRYDSLIRVQGETLDNLAQAIAVFGSDGRIRLHNPAFASMWKLDPNALNERPHIEAVIGWCRALYGDDKLWRKLRATATAIEGREHVTDRLERRDGSVVDLATVPLPDGATLVTFLDVTDSINVERALREKNEALETADVLKVDFVQHVSYELRSPLTNIIGFAHFLAEPSIGPLTDKQREYLGYINTSTSALLAIINDILDLATIDAGAMKLNLGPVDIRKTMEAAAEGIKDRLVKGGLTLDITCASSIGSFTADERRIRQVLFNLLANAVGFAPGGSTVSLNAERRSDALVFRVTDNGPGIPPEIKDRVFDWFETHSNGSRHRGAGLGLSIVRSFVELHGGKVTIDSTVGQGTTVECTFPLEHHVERTAA
jgi:signal transduction histidine kinase